jgi:hypothetical protein
MKIRTHINADPDAVDTVRGPDNQRDSRQLPITIMTRRCAVLVVGIFLLAAGRAGAQQPAGKALIQVLCPNVDGVCVGALDISAIQALRDNLATQATTFPIGSSSGGFTWTFDSALGIQTRRSNSFGSMFAERPLTNGRKKLNVALDYQHTKFDSVAGQPLGDLKSVFDLGTETLNTLTLNTSLDVAIDRTTVSASYGLTDRVDIGLIVPFGRTQVAGSSRFVWRDRLGNEVARVNGPDEKGSSNGIGDITVRAKVAVPSPPAVELAAGVDLRLPTGDPDGLLGVGATQTKVMVMGALPRGMVAPHFNVGYTWAGSDVRSPFNVFNEVNYIVGADLAATPAVTVIGDVIGRTLRGAGKIEFTDTPFPGFTTDTGNVNLLLGTVGAKVKVSGMWLLTASVVFPLNNGGVKPGVTPVIGFERAF